MHKKVMIKITIGILLLITLFLPSFSVQTNSYQFGLWTSDEFPPERSTGTTFRFGKTIDGIIPWKRIRMGVPLKPITVDYQKEHSILQGRIEWDAMIVNLVFVSIVAILCRLFFLVIRKHVRGLSQRA